MSRDITGSRELRVLFVCTGNMYRSPLAERLLASRLPDVRVSSAGTRAWGGRGGMRGSGEGGAGRSGGTGSSRDSGGPGMDAAARTALESLGGDGTGFRSTPLTTELITAADLVLGLAREHRDEAVRMHPAALRRSFTLKEFLRLARHTGGAPESARTPLELISRAAAQRGTPRPVPAVDDEVADPEGRGPEVLMRCAREIDTAVAALAALLAPAATDGAPPSSG
ncbi:low molecular weight phosphatase family protein [Streptomyces sp. NPDC127084]|uniref:arsenate reductase/protein-tyrosine-phosphatase family protein n=1 Tax=Streptomyces sp. NPDC127084 TaxID=3347133 RepID=UPI00365917F2